MWKTDGMKNWHKIFKFKKYDVLLLRMCNEKEGEHIQLIVRIPDGQFVKTVSFEDDVERADEFFQQYEKKHAQEFIVEFEKVLDESRQTTTADV